MTQDVLLGKKLAQEVYRGAIFAINHRDPDLGFVLQHEHECIEDAKAQIQAVKVEQRVYAGLIISVLLALVGFIVNLKVQAHL